MEHLKDFANNSVATLNAHYLEDLSCMHRKNNGTRQEKKNQNIKENLAQYLNERGTKIYC